MRSDLSVKIRSFSGKTKVQNLAASTNVFFYGKGYFCEVMRHIYSFFIRLFQALLPLLGLFSSKLKEFRNVRKPVFDDLMNAIKGSDRTLWVHAASLGEYEQAVPVLEGLRLQYPEHKIVLTFFSPSGYTIKKDTSLADVVTYLPLDTKAYADKFINIVSPELALFVKYEFWPNYLNKLKRNKIHTLLISGVFRESQPFFKFYGSWMKKSLEAFNYFFLQNKSSLKNLKKLGFSNAEVSGDTRFDRVSRQLNYDNTLAFITEFKQDKLLLVCGSTWPEDEALLLDFLNSKTDVKVVIAPHKISAEKIETFRNMLHKNVVLYSELQYKKVQEADVLIIDAIGFLTKIYAYADLAYVGGAAGNTGLHNVLEPATFGLPILTGTHIDKFPEAGQMNRLAALFTVETPRETSEVLEKLISDKKFRAQTGFIAGQFVTGNTGATETVLNYLKNQTLTA